MRLLRWGAPALLAAAWFATEPPGTFAQRNTQLVTVRVNGVPVTAGEVARFRSRHLAGEKAEGRRRDLLDAVALKQLVEQRLVVRWLERYKQAISPGEIDAAVASFQRQADLLKMPLERYLEADYGDEASLRRELAWRLGWAKFMAHESSDAALEAFFNAHRRHFDGTKIRVSQIFWKVEPEDELGREKALKAASEVRSQIVAGKLSFAEAVGRHSQAPSRDNAGDLGFITRHGEMHESFARAAFDLEPGELSPPVVTPHGVHLVLCGEVRRGDKSWRDVREALQERYALHRFEQIVAEEQKRADVEFLGTTPYFDPGDGKLVLPK